MSDERDRAPRPPEQPRSEPEIIPPDRAARRGSEYAWTSVDGRGGTHRIYVARPGPFSIIIALILAGLVLGGILLLLLGLALIWIPALIFIVAALLIAGYSRYYWQRLKSWASVQRSR
jgi:hypothetical protein